MEYFANGHCLRCYFHLVEYFIMPLTAMVGLLMALHSHMEEEPLQNGPNPVKGVN